MTFLLRHARLLRITHRIAHVRSGNQACRLCRATWAGLERGEVRFLSALAKAEGRRSGQGLVEYALILALIAIVAIVSLALLGSQISAYLQEIGSRLNG